MKKEVYKKPPPRQSKPMNDNSDKISQQTPDGKQEKPPRSRPDKRRP